MERRWSGRWPRHGVALAGGFRRPGALWVQYHLFCYACCDRSESCPCVFKHAVYSGILVVNHWAPFSHGELKFFRTLLEPVKKAIAEEYRKGFVYKVLVLGMPMKHVVDVFLNNTVFF